MATPTGLCSASTYAAFKAGVDNKREIPFLDNAGDELTGSFLDLGAMKTRSFRIMIYLRTLFDELVAKTSAEELVCTPIILLLPEDFPLTAVDVSTALASDPDNNSVPEESSGYLSPSVTIHPEFIHRVHGHATDGFTALQLAKSVLDKGSYDTVFLCAADSLINAVSLQSLDSHHRLLTNRNSDGMIPGEAAAGVMLTSASKGAMCYVNGVGYGSESSTLYNDIPLRAEGICQATRQALDHASLQMHDIDTRISDAAGESFHFKEQALMVNRLLRQNKEHFDLILPARTLGHTGCCTSLCALALTAMKLNNPDNLDTHALLCSGDDDGHRAVVVSSKMPGVMST